MRNNLISIVDDLLVATEKLKDIDIEYIKLMEKYKVLSELDADPKSKHRMHMKISKLIIETIKELQKYEQ